MRKMMFSEDWGIFIVFCSFFDMKKLFQTKYQLSNLVPFFEEYDAKA